MYHAVREFVHILTKYRYSPSTTEIIHAKPSSGSARILVLLLLLVALCEWFC